METLTTVTGLFNVNLILRLVLKPLHCCPINLLYSITQLLKITMRSTSLLLKKTTTTGKSRVNEFYKMCLCCCRWVYFTQWNSCTHLAPELHTPWPQTVCGVDSRAGCDTLSLVSSSLGWTSVWWTVQVVAIMLYESKRSYNYNTLCLQLLHARCYLLFTAVEEVPILNPILIWKSNTTVHV